MRKSKRSGKNFVTPRARARLKTILKENGFTQNSLSKKLGFFPQFLSLLLLGYYPVPLSFWRRVEKALGKRRGYFTDGK